MAEPESFTGFPRGELTFRTDSELVRDRVNQVTEALLHSDSVASQNLEHEDYRLVLAAPPLEGQEAEDWAICLRWPIAKDAYDQIHNPSVDDEPKEPPKTQVAVEESSLDMFLPKQVPRDEDIQDIVEFDEQKRVRIRRSYMLARFKPIFEFLDRLPDDPFINDYLGSFGDFDREQNQTIPMGFNFDGIDRNIVVRQGGSIRSVFDIPSTAVSSGSIDTIAGEYTSLVDGLTYSSRSERDNWQRAVVGDVRHLADQLRGVPAYYLDRLNERGYLYSSEEHFGKERQIGTFALREFFRGYYQFASSGTTLLKVMQHRNQYGAVDFKDSRQVNLVNTIFLAVKHGVEGFPHLVKIQTTNSFEAEEEDAVEFSVSPSAPALDGMGTDHRIGGFYGDMTKDPKSFERLRDGVKQTIQPAILGLLIEMQPVGIVETGFSHTDFYRTIEHLSDIS